MSVFKNVNIKQYFQRYGMMFGFFRILYTAAPIHFVADYENKKLLYYKTIYKHLQHKYYKDAPLYPEGLEYCNEQFENNIWIYWRDGLENMPQIVLSCVKSIRSQFTDKIIIIDDRNLSNYIKMPNYIMRKYNEGKISVAAFSDLIRFSLLAEYGGTWIDSTVFLTGPINPEILKSDFFAIRDSFGLIENKALFASWFLHSAPNNTIVKETRNMLFSYWRSNNHVIEYLLPYLFLTLSIKQNNYDDNIPYMESGYSHQLFSILDNSFKDYEFNYICSLTSIHKLSYKIDEEKIKNKNNYYNYILKWGDVLV